MDEHPDAAVIWVTSTEDKRGLRAAQADQLSGGLPQRLRLLSCKQLETMEMSGWLALAQLRPACLVLDGCRTFTAVQWEQQIKRLFRFCPDAALLGLFSPDQPAFDLEVEDLFADAVVSHLTLAQAMAQGLLPVPAKVIPLVRPGRGPLDEMWLQIKTLRTLDAAETSEHAVAALIRAVDKCGPVEQHLARAVAPGRVLVLCQGQEAVHYTEIQADEFCGAGARVRAMPDGWDDAVAAEFAADDAAGWSVLLAADSPALRKLPGVSAAVLVRTDQNTDAYHGMVGHALAVCGSVPLVEIHWHYKDMNEAASLRRSCEDAGGPSYPLEEPLRAVSRQARLLQQSLDSQWDQFYSQLKALVKRCGILNVSRSSVSENGLPVGRWLEVQRQIQAGDRSGSLTADQIARLEKLGVAWKHRLEQAWERGYASALRYRKKHGDLVVPVRFCDRSGFALGEWIVYNRQRRLCGSLSDQRIERLQALGMVWDTARALWDQSYAAAVQYLLEFGTLEIPIKYVSPGGISLGVWLGSQRTAYKDGTLTPDQIVQLEALGVDWTNRNDRKWQAAYEAAVRYHEAHGDLNVPSEYIDPDGMLLGKWVSRQRYAWQNPERSSARVTPERKALLDRLGMVWAKPDSWKHRLELAQEYKQTHGDLNIPSQYRTEEGIWLGSWLSRQKQMYLRKDPVLSAERRMALAELFRGEVFRREPVPGAAQCSVREQNWLNNYTSAKNYFKRFGDLLVPASYVDESGCRLGVWISNLRAARKNRPTSYQVTPEHVSLLDAIGMQWDAREAKWQCAVRRAAEYRARNGNLQVPVNYKSEDGFCLGDWVRRMRESYEACDGKLTEERIEQLKALELF